MFFPIWFYFQISYRIFKYPIGFFKLKVNISPVRVFYKSVGDGLAPLLFSEVSAYCPICWNTMAAQCFNNITKGVFRTWFWQIGFVLYSPGTNAWKWDHSSHESLLIVTMIFAWHCGAVFILMCFCGTAIHFINMLMAATCLLSLTTNLWSLSWRNHLVKHPYDCRAWCVSCRDMKYL